MTDDVKALAEWTLQRAKDFLKERGAHVTDDNAKLIASFAMQETISLQSVLARCRVYIETHATNAGTFRDLLSDIDRLASQREDVIDREAVSNDDLMKLARKHFNEKQRATLTYAMWKDGIDIDLPTYNLRSFADAILAAQPRSNRVEPSK